MRHMFQGPQDIELASDQLRKLRFTIMSDGCAVFLVDAEGSELVYAGSGSGNVRVSTSATHMQVRPFRKEGVIRLDIPELRDLDSVNWLNEPGFTDLSPRPYGQISPEIQAVMDQMNRNAIVREQAMLRALQRRTV